MVATERIISVVALAPLALAVSSELPCAAVDRVIWLDSSPEYAGTHRPSVQATEQRSPTTRKESLLRAISEEFEFTRVVDRSLQTQEHSGRCQHEKTGGQSGHPAH